MGREEHLRELDQLLRDVASSLKSAVSVVAQFVDPAGGLIKRSALSPPGGGIDYATCTGFTLYYLVGADLVRKANTGTGPTVFSADEAETIVASLSSAIIAGHKSRRSKPATTTARLPNQYNSAIQIAGYLKAVSKLGLTIPAEAWQSCANVVTTLAKSVMGNRGFVPRIGEPPTLSSSYLTFWTTAMLVEWRDCNEATGKDPALDDLCSNAVEAVAKWSIREACKGISYHHSGLKSHFDIAELIYATLCAVQFGATPESIQLGHHVFTVLFDGYFADGCFAPSAPVLADKDNFSLQVPTAESLALVLTACPQIVQHEWTALREVFRWLERRAGKGWFAETDGIYGNPTAFMTTSALVFLAGLRDLLDRLLAEMAARELQVAPYSFDRRLETISYPGDLKEVLQSNVVTPIRGRTYLNLASYSMILYGPPGTAKTTIARKLAQDLEWPLLTINQSEFLRAGIDNIDAEADRIFKLASYLKEVVVLFDEVEELVGERTGGDKLSRLLTTSMLPRIHHLRDRQRIVFIFATNHLGTMDTAASRLGRFDIIRCIMPPQTPGERQAILDALLGEFEAEADVVSAFKDAMAAEHTDGMSYVDLRGVVRRVLVAKRIRSKPADTNLINDSVKIGNKTVKSDELKKFQDSIEKHDRS